MRLLQSPNADMKALSIIAPIIKGGTGADNSTEAVQNLGGLNAAFLGQPNGVAKLNAQGKLDLTAFPDMVTVGPTLSGPTTVYTGQTVQYTITNYDINTAYTVTASVGTLTRSGDTITYTAPVTTGTLVLTVNSKVAEVSIENTAPIAPNITSPVTGSTNLGSSVSLSASTFLMNVGSDNHLSSDWQVATDNTFNNVISSTTNDTINKTNWSATGLSPNTTYYARVRYKGTVSGYGPWSASISFTTKVNFLPTNEIALLTASDKVASDGFGNTNITINSTGDRIFIGRNYYASSSARAKGAVYIFVKNNGTWTEESIISPSELVNGDDFGYSLTIDNLGNRLAVSAIGQDPSGVSGAGSVYIFSRSGSTWTQEAKILPNSPTAKRLLGQVIKFDSSANRIAINAEIPQKVYIYSRSGTTWTLEATISKPESSNHSFSYSLDFTSNGDRIIIADPSIDYPNTNPNVGRVYIYSRSGTTWSLEATINSPVDKENYLFGYNVAISKDGSYIAVANNFNNTSPNFLRCISIYKRSGTTWTLQQTFNDPAYVDGPLSIESSFGKSLKFSINNDHLFIGAPTSRYVENSTYISSHGLAYIYSKDIETWSITHTYTGINSTGIIGLGQSLDFTDDLSQLIISAYMQTVGGLTYCGAVHVFA